MTRKHNQEHVANKPVNNVNEDSSQKSSMDYEREIALLKKKLNEAQIAADAYNLMIDLAEKRFNISIRKKFGAKQ